MVGGAGGEVVTTVTHVVGGAAELTAAVSFTIVLATTEGVALSGIGLEAATDMLLAGVEAVVTADVASFSIVGVALRFCLICSMTCTTFAELVSLDMGVTSLLGREGLSPEVAGRATARRRLEPGLLTAFTCRRWREVSEFAASAPVLC